MPKQRRTKRDKQRSSQKKPSTGGFVINEAWLKTKPQKKEIDELPVQKEIFKADLTKTLILTMLVLALELALWQYLLRH